MIRFPCRPRWPARAFATGTMWFLVAARPVEAQLPSLTAPRGTIRFEFGGSFEPATDVYAAGRRVALGSLVSGPFDAALSPLVGEVDARVAAITGTAPSLSLGRLGAVADWQRGTGTIGLAFGVARRLTLFGTLPIVSVRTQVELTPDATGATLGANPADLVLGTSSGINQTASFFTAFDAALTELGQRIANGDYAGDPARLAVAQSLMATAPGLRDALFALLADPDISSPVLPLAESTAGAAVLARISSVQDALTNTLGIAFAGMPALPATPLGAEGIASLLDASTAYGFAPRNQAPRVALGDIELGAVYALVDRGAALRGVSAWLRAMARLPTGDAYPADELLGQGTGDGQLDLEVGATVDAASGRFGIRGDLAYTRQMQGTVQARLGDVATPLLPARFLAAVDRDPGDVVTVGVQPYLRIVPRLALTGLLQHVRRGADVVTLAEGQAPIAGADPGLLGRNTEARATRVGLGLNYAHDGVQRDGERRMPVEAALMVERTVASGAGVVPASLTTRLMLRVYKRVSR